MVFAWELSHEMDRLRTEVDRLFAQMLSGPAAGDDGRQVIRPPVTAMQREDAYEVLVDLPGVRAEGLEAELQESTLRVRAIRDAGRAYERTLRLPEDVERERISADLSDGVLRLNLPRQERVRPRRIEIGTGDGQAQLESAERREAEGADDREPAMAAG